MIGHPNLWNWYKLDGNLNDAAGRDDLTTVLTPAYTDSVFGKGLYNKSGFGYKDSGATWSTSDNKITIAGWVTTNANTSVITCLAQLQNATANATVTVSAQIVSLKPEWLVLTTNGAGKRFAADGPSLSASTRYHLIYAWDDSAGSEAITKMKIFVNGVSQTLTSVLKETSPANNLGNLAVRKVVGDDTSTGINSRRPAELDDLQIYKNYAVWNDGDAKRIMMGLHPFTRS